MADNSKLLEQQNAEILALITKTTSDYERLQKLNQRLSIGLGLGAILLSFGATIAGINGSAQAAKIAAGFAAASGTLQGILFAYPVDRRSAFYRSLAAKNKNLLVLDSLESSNQEQLAVILEKFKAIRLEAAHEEPQSENFTNSLSLENLEVRMEQLEKLLASYKRVKSELKETDRSQPTAALESSNTHREN